MSTKIHKGFIVETASAAHLLKLVADFRPWIEGQAQQLLQEFLTAAKVGPTQGWHLWTGLRAKTVEKGLRMPGIDTDFELVFFPDGSHFLGIAYTEHAAWFEEWLKQPGVKEYGYFNNSDRPDEISEAEWDQRSADWGRVVGHNIPAMVGLSVKVSDPMGPFPALSLTPEG